MNHAETLTHGPAVRFAAIELETAARWVMSRASSAKTSPSRLVATFRALDAILARSRGVAAIRGLMPGSGLEILYLPSARAGVGTVVSVPGEIDPEALAEIGNALRSEFIASGHDMVRIEADDGSELIVHAIEAQGLVLAATGVQLLEMPS